MAQGFVQILNLNESNSVSRDRSALDNLGGPGISRDLQLFSNNIQNTTVISANTFTVDSDFVVLDTNLYQISFSNRTRVTQGNEVFTVINSNGEDRFQLVNANDIVVSPNTSLDIVRSDTITLRNLNNLITSGITTDQNTNNILGEESASVSGSSVIISTINQTTTRVTLQEYFDRIESIIDKYRYDRIFSIVTDIPQSFNRRIVYKSTITVTNDNAISLPTSPGTVDLAPGIFIASGTNAQRAFSNNNNPWSDTVIGSGYMLTNSSSATISTLVVTNPDFENLSTTTVLPSDVLTDFTHKIETVINGETYYLLCSNN